MISKLDKLVDHIGTVGMFLVRLESTYLAFRWNQEMAKHADRIVIETPEWVTTTPDDISYN